MKKLRKLLVLLLLVMSGSVIAQEQLFSPPYVYENTNGLLFLKGLYLADNVTTLVIPNKIDGCWVGGIYDRVYQWKTKDRPRAGGGWWSKWNEMPFSIFKYSCNVDNTGYFDVEPVVSDNQYEVGQSPGASEIAEVVGTPLSIEEIVFPYFVKWTIGANAFRNLSSLREVYFRSPDYYFEEDFTGCTNLDGIHLECDVPDKPFAEYGITHTINLYVPQKYLDNYKNDPDWGGSQYLRIFAEPTNVGSTLKIKNNYPGLLLRIDGHAVNGDDSPDYQATMHFGKYHMPQYRVSYSGIGEVKLILNGQTLDDVEDKYKVLELNTSENILEVEVVTMSEVTFNSNGCAVKWNGEEILGASGGTYKVTNVRSDTYNSFEVDYNSNNKELHVMKGSNEIFPNSDINGKAVFELDRVTTDLKYDIQITDKRCSVTINATNISGGVTVSRELDGTVYSTFLLNGMSFEAGQGTALWYEAPNGIHLVAASMGNVNGVLVPTSNGVDVYKFIVPNSSTATLTLVAQEVSTGTVSEDFSYAPLFLTKMGNGTVMYDDWFLDREDREIHSTGTLTTPVSTILAPYDLLHEDGSGWKLTLTPDPGCQLTTFYGSWDTGETIAEVSVLSSVNFLTEKSYRDNVAEVNYPYMDGPTALQKFAEGEDFSLDLETGRTISFDASTGTWTLLVEGEAWESISMNITIGFSNPNETNQKEMHVVAVGQPTHPLCFECDLRENNEHQSEVLRTAGSFTKRYQLGELQNSSFLIFYDEGYEIEGNGGQVRIPFTVYHNGEDVTNGFTYEDGQIICDLDENTMEGTWTFVFPDAAQTAETKWTFLKSGEGVLKCEIEPKDASADPTVYSVGDEGRTLHIETAAADLVMVKVEPTPGNTFKAYRNGDDVTGDFTLFAGEYILTTHQADLRDANWTVLFSEDVSSPYFTYQLSQTAGGEVTVGVIPVGGLGDDAPAELNVVEDGSMTLRLTNAEAEGIVIFVDPDQNMTVRIYEGDTDVTSQFTYDSATNTYMRQTSSLASESLLFVFADKDELGIDIIDFADAEVKRICVAPGLGWDTNGDGELSKAEAAAVTTLLRGEDSVFWSSDISSFDEFQYFTGLTSLEEYAFQDCSQLKHITLPESITSISEFAFDGCISLESIELPKTVESIGYLAFYNCSKLRSFFLPANVGSVEGALFFGCANLVSVVVDENNAVYDSRNNCNAIIQKENKVLVSSCSTTSLPDDLEQIGPMAFAGLSVSRVEIPASIKSIGKEAFYQMSNLKTIVMKHSDPFAFNKMFFGSSSGYPSSLTLEVPEGTIDAYKQKGWKTLDEGGVFKEIREIPEYDANGDGQTTIVDVTRLVDKIIGK